MERVGTLHRCRAAFGDDFGDPVRLISQDVVSAAQRSGPSWSKNLGLAKRMQMRDHVPRVLAFCPGR